MSFKKKVGFVASCFDLLHSGHMLMLEDAKKHCDYLIVALQTDPTIDRPEKNKPIQSLKERKIQISSIKYVDKVIVYSTEKELYDLLVEIKPDIRILGDDYIGKKFTGSDLDIDVFFSDRSHGYSTTNLRERIYNAELQKKLSLDKL
jgi:glycerol-3-phosphate cytidylyltransferase